MKILDVPRSGSYADKTSSHNRAGQYVRNRRAPVQPIGTGRRAFIRASFGSVSALWGALTDTQRAAWTSFADGVPYTDRLGQTFKLTGQQMYVAINTQLLNCVQPTVSVPPASTAMFTFIGPTFSAAAAVPSLDVTFNSTGAADDFILVAYSPPMSAGRSFTGTFWQAAVVAGNSADYDGNVAFAGQFGALVAGQRVFVRCTPVNKYGVTGAPFILSTIVAA